MSTITDRKSGSASASTASSRLGGLPEGLGFKAPVKAATTANITLSGAQTIDGVSIVAEDRVLVKDQTTGSENGIYVAASGNWERAPDAALSGDLVEGTRVWVTDGTTNGETEWIITTADDITIDTTSITWESIVIYAASINTSAKIAAIVTDETGTGALVFGTSPTLTTSALLSSGFVFNWNGGDVTLTHSANALAFAGGSQGYSFDATVYPASNDGGALGGTGNNWSDLYLASGGTINWSASDVVVTHSANTLAFTGASSDYTFDVPIALASGGTGASTAAGARTALGLRTKLTANVEYDVPGDYATLGDALDFLEEDLDGGGFDVDIQMADGTSYVVSEFLKSYVGIRKLTIKGNNANKQAVKLTPSTTFVFQSQEPHSTIFEIKDMEIVYTGCTFGAIGVYQHGDVILRDLYWSGSGTSDTMLQTTVGNVVMFGTHTIADTGTSNVLLASGDNAFLSVEPTTELEFIGTPTVAGAFQAYRNGVISMQSAVLTDGANVSGFTALLTSGGVVDAINSTGTMPGTAISNDGTGTFKESSALITRPIAGTSLNLGNVSSPVQAMAVSGNSVLSGYLRVGSTTAPTNTTAGDLTVTRLNVGNVTQVQNTTISGDGSLTGYLRIGSNTAPTNTTAGDITGIRLSLNNGVALAATTGLIFRADTTVTDTSGTTISMYNRTTNTPSGASTAANYVSYFDMLSTGSNNVGTTYGSRHQSTFRASGDGTAIGSRHIGTVQDASSVNFGTISTVGALVQAFSSSGNTATGTVASAIGIRIDDSVKQSQTMTGQAGIAVGALDDATNNTAILLGTLTIPTGTFGIYNSATNQNYLAGGLSIGTTTDPGTGGLLANTSIRAATYARIGSASAPTNTTAGDITGVRLSLGNSAAFSASAGLFLNATGTNTATSGTNHGYLYSLTVAPSGASTGHNRALAGENTIDTAQDITAVAVGGYFRNYVVDSGAISAPIGVDAVGLSLDASSTSMGTIGTAIAGSFTSLSSTGHALTSTVSNAVGVDINTITNSGSGPLTVTSQAGLRVVALSGATNNTHVLIGTGTIPSGNYAIYSSSTSDSLLSGFTSFPRGIGRGAPVTESGTTHSVAATTSHLICNNAGTVTVTLPAAASFTGREIYIKNIDGTSTVISASSNVVPVTSATAGTAILPATDGAWALLVSDGTNWIIMAQAVS